MTERGQAFWNERGGFKPFVCCSRAGYWVSHLTSLLPPLQLWNDLPPWRTGMKVTQDKAVICFLARNRYQIRAILHFFFLFLLPTTLSLKQTNKQTNAITDQRKFQLIEYMFKFLPISHILVTALQNVSSISKGCCFHTWGAPRCLVALTALCTWPSLQKQRLFQEFYMHCFLFSNWQAAVPPSGQQEVAHFKKTWEDISYDLLLGRSLENYQFIFFSPHLQRPWAVESSWHEK